VREHVRSLDTVRFPLAIMPMQDYTAPNSAVKVEK
jgi:hypothetical protein